MTSDRAHRPALGWNDAIAEISDNSGSWYDPDVVTALCVCEEDLRTIFLRSHHQTETA